VPQESHALSSGDQRLKSAVVPNVLKSAVVSGVQLWRSRGEGSPDEVLSHACPGFLLPPLLVLPDPHVRDLLGGGRDGGLPTPRPRIRYIGAPAMPEVSFQTWWPS